MDPEQFAMYQLARDKERIEQARKNTGFKKFHYIAKPKSSSVSTYRVRSRQLSNYNYDPAEENSESNDYSSAKFKAILKNVMNHPNQLGLVYSQFVEMGGIEPFKRFLILEGGFEEFAGETSESGDKTMETVEEEPIDDEAIVEETIVKLPILMSKKAVSNDGTHKPRFAVICGKTHIQYRDTIKQVFNDQNNRYGSTIRLIIISGSGSEGLDLKCVRHVHIMEPFWNDGRHQQVKSRAIRNDSHSSLEESERDVQTYIYIALPPRDELPLKYKDFALTQDQLLQSTDLIKVYNAEPSEDGTIADNGLNSTDLELYVKSIKSMVSIDTFCDAMKEVSIECALNAEDYCRVCQAGSTLFTEDLEEDLLTGDKCRTVVEKKIKAKELIISDQSYYYIPATPKESIHGYKVYKKNGDGSFVQVPESDDIFLDIIEALSKLTIE